MIRGRWLTGSAVILLGAVTAACVSGEPRGRSSRESTDRDQEERRPAVSTAWLDTISPVSYQVFEQTVLSENPRKTMLRLMALEYAVPEALSKTLRLALDSIGRSDSSLVAARAILYTVRLTGQMEGELVPTIWGEWVPPEGWDAAAPASRNKVYRTYTYHGSPGWGRPGQRPQGGQGGP